MLIKTRRDKIETIELSKTINKRKTDDIQKYIKIVEKTLKKEHLTLAESHFML